MSTLQQYLAAYDDQLRTEAETPGALVVRRLGPLRLVTFPGGRGFVTYRDLAGADPLTLATWVDQVQAHFAADPAITSVEWKTRGHDHAPGLHDALVQRGFVPDAPESIMIGEVTGLITDAPLAEGVTLRQVSAPEDVRAACAMQNAIFGNDAPVDDFADALLHRLAADDGMQLWVAEADGQIICAGRLDPVPGTEFAGIWGGATLPDWRRRGVYRALTAARARSALALGKRLIHSDSTDYSRPILERSGFVCVSTTTPYEWRISRADAG